MFSNSSSGGAFTYAKVSNGFFTISVEKGTPNAVTRVNVQGREVHELRNDTVEGRIIFLDLKTNTFNGEDIVSLNLGLSGVAEKSVIQMKFPSAYSRGFLNRIDNIDFSKDVVLKAGQVFDKEKDKNNPFLLVFQDGRKLDSTHTKDTPNGLPQLVKVKFKGKDTWDDTEQQDFYKAKIEKYSAIIEATKSPVANIPAPRVAPQLSKVEESSDDLPF
jgi:hypothetical protein